MRIRLIGTRTDCDTTVQQLRVVLHVAEVSAFYPNRGDSQLGRVYLETLTRPADPEGTTS